MKTTATHLTAKHIAIQQNWQQYVLVMMTPSYLKKEWGQDQLYGVWFCDMQSGTFYRVEQIQNEGGLHQ
jgi:hypothetical protein